MKKGDAMTLQWTGKGSLIVTVRQKVLGEIKNSGLAAGLLGEYLGSKPVSPALKKDIEESGMFLQAAPKS